MTAQYILVISSSLIGKVLGAFEVRGAPAVLGAFEVLGVLEVRGAPEVWGPIGLPFLQY